MSDIKLDELKYISITDLDTLQTGDLVFFSSNGIYPWFIKHMTENKWSHVGMIVKDPNFLHNNNGVKKGIYLLESDGKYEVDIDTNKKMFGVQIVDCKKLIEDSDAIIGVKKLEWNLDNNARNELLKPIYDTIYQKTYDWFPQDLLDALFNYKGWSWGEWLLSWIDGRHVDRMFCSALAAYIYTLLGLLDKDTKWSTCVPAVMAELTVLHDTAKLTDIIIIKTT